MATKAQLLTDLRAKPRVHSVFSEVHTATRDNLKAYTIGVMIYVTDEELLIKRIAIQMVVTDEGTPQEVAHWEQDRENNISQIDYPAPASAFEQAVERKITELEGDGTIIQTISKTLYPANNVVVLRAIVADGTSGSKEVNRLAKWDEQGDTWTLKAHTPANG